MADTGGRVELNEIAVGMRYEVELPNGLGFIGTVMGYDSLPDPKVIMFEEGGTTTATGNKNLRTVYAKFITKLTCLGEGDETLDIEKCVVDLGELEEKEARAIREIARIGFGVTKEAQSIFDELSTRFHVEWENTDILVMNVVRVRSPYDSSCITGTDDYFVNRVKEVVEHRRRIKKEQP